LAGKAENEEDYGINEIDRSVHRMNHGALDFYEPKNVMRLHQE